MFNTKERKIKTNKMMATVALVLLLSVATLLTGLSAVSAQTTKTKTLAFVNISPKIVGLGDSVVINAWTSPVPLAIPGSVGASGYAIGQPRVGYTYTFTRPDGSTDVVIGSNSFGEGSAWGFYTPNAVRSEERRVRKDC
jgi:hypothetical protein